MTLPDSQHFTLHELAEGVYAAIAKASGGARSNGGIIDLGGAALVFDCFMLPQAASDLCAFAAQLTGSPVRYAINSHWHADHVFGNAALPPDTVLISTDRTRELIAERIPHRLEMMRAELPQYERENAALAEQLQTVRDPDERARLQNQITQNDLRLESMPGLPVVLPDATFDQRLTLHGTTRAAEIITFGGGHTDSDAILWLPEARLVFAADLLFYGSHPWVGDGHPAIWPLLLDEIEVLGPEVVVPGHGELATVAAFPLLRRYLTTLHRLVQAITDAGGTAEDATMPEEFAGLEAPARFHNNVRALLARQQAGA